MESLPRQLSKITYLSGWLLPMLYRDILTENVPNGSIVCQRWEHEPTLIVHCGELNECGSLVPKKVGSMLASGKEEDVLIDL